MPRIAINERMTLRAGAGAIAGVGVLMQIDTEYAELANTGILQ